MTGLGGDLSIIMKLSCAACVEPDTRNHYTPRRYLMRRLAGLAAVVVLGLSSHAMAQGARQQAVANRALSTILPEVKFQGSPLKDVFDFLRDVSGANIHVNWRALE